MNKLMEVVQAIIDSLRSAVQWTTKKVWAGGKWTTKLVAERVAAPVARVTWAATKATGRTALATPGVTARGLKYSGAAVAGGAWKATKATGRAAIAAPGVAQRGLNGVGDTVVRGIWNGAKTTGNAAIGAVGATLSIPGRVLGGIFGGGGGGGQRSAATAATGAQVEQSSGSKDTEAQSVRQLADDVGLIQRAARFRLKGHDIIEKFGDVIQADQMKWLKALTTAELKLVAEADLRVLAQFLMGQLSNIPGVRNASEISAGPRAATPSPANAAAAPTYAPKETAVLNTLATRINKRKQKPGKNPVVVETNDNDAHDDYEDDWMRG